jgi:hypothetical protein
MRTFANVRVTLWKTHCPDSGRTDAVNAARLPQPPVMQLVEQRRDRLGMSKRAAAALAGISEARWRQLENGYREIRGVPVTEEAPDSTLARMALAVRLAPADVEPFSPRAAQMLGDLLAERDAHGQQDADDAARMVDALDGDGRGLTGRQRQALEADVAESLRRLRSG